MHAPTERSSSSMARGIRWPRLYDLLLFGMTRGSETRFRQEVLDLAGIAPGQRVLDVGCGTGTQAVAAARRVGPGGAVTGVDVSPEMLSVAQGKASRARVSIDFRQATATALPFPDQSFDRVLMCMARHMLPEADRATCIGELVRVLAPAGQLLLIDYAGPVSDRSSMMARHGPHGRFDLNLLHAPMKAAGLDRVSIRPASRLDMHVLHGAKAR